MGSRVPLHAILRLLESPSLIRQGMRHAVRKRLTVALDVRRSNGTTRPPVELGLKLVDACNLRCKMCSQWGETGYNFLRPASELKQLVPLETYKQLIDDVAEFKPWMYIWGGEPFLYRDLLPLMAYMKEQGLTISISTNGTLMDKHIERLVEIETDIILFSIDGPRHTHDDIRGYQGAFDKTMGAIRALQAEKRRQGKARPYLTMVSVVTANNQDNLESLFEVCEEAGADLMLTYYSWFQTQDSGARQTALLEERLGITPWSWRGYLWNVGEIDPGAVAGSVERINARRWSFPYLFFPNLKLADIPAYYRDHTQTFGYDRCIAPWILTGIMPNGDVVACRDYPDVVLGNIKDEPFLDIWNNEHARTFRQLLRGEGLMPICTRCEGLMEF